MRTCFYNALSNDDNSWIIQVLTNEWNLLMNELRAAALLRGEGLSGARNFSNVVFIAFTNA